MKRRAFTLPEILIAIGLFVIVGFVSAKLFIATVNLSEEAAAGQDQIARDGRALALLRRDAWGAQSMQVEGRAVRLEQADGATVAWQWADDGTLVRREAESEQRWGEVIREGAFAAEGPMLVLAGVDGEGQALAVRVVSQVMMAGER